MNFTELVNAVISDTNRPDMGFTSNGGTGEIPDAIVAATLWAHSTEFYFRDIKSAQVVFDASAYVQTLDMSVVQRFKALNYIRKWDPTLLSSQINPNNLPPLSSGVVSTSQALNFFKLIDADDILDSEYGFEKTDVAYMAGSVLFMKSSTSFKYAMMAWYGFPNIDWQHDQYDSWIAALFPNVIKYAASSTIFNATGNIEVVRKYDHPELGLVAMNLRNLKLSAVLPRGY